MKKALVIGDVYLETQYFVEDIPSEEEFTFSNNVLQRAGSKTLNSARALQVLGYEVDYYGLIGNDPASILVKSFFEKYSINKRYLQEVNSATGNISVITNSSGNSSITLFSGANSMFDKEDIQRILGIMDNYDFIYTSTNFESEYLYELSSNKNNHFFIDFPNNHNKFDLSKFGNNVWLMPNRKELGLICDEDIKSTKVAVNNLIKIKNESDANFLVTLDSDGAVATTEEGIISNSIARKYKEVDSIGLGDIFRAIFANKLSVSSDVEESIGIANVMTAPLIQVKGIDDKINKLKN